MQKVGVGATARELIHGDGKTTLDITRGEVQEEKKIEQARVSFARFKTRTSYWRKLSHSKTQQKPGVGTEDINQSKPREAENNANPSYCSQMNQREVKELKRVEGFVEEEALSKLNKCAVGLMATVCSTSSVEERLNNWGLGEISIKSMGGKCFLIEFKDQDLFDYLKEQDWSYLLEVFIEVEPWTEFFHLPERITWIQVEGIPLHCWDEITFNRIAETCGTLVALGENANQSLDGDKITLLVSTIERNNLDGVLELEAGRECFLIRVKELGFNIHSAFKSNEDFRMTRISSPTLDKEESCSESSPEKNTEPPSINLEIDTNLGEDAYINVLSTGTQKKKQWLNLDRLEEILYRDAQN
ncbi:hypothetical protein V6N13_128293 [Hibiscus sabdariffa]